MHAVPVRHAEGPHADGSGAVWDTELLGELSQCMRDASICGLGQAASNPLTSVIRYFPRFVLTSAAQLRSEVGSDMSTNPIDRSAPEEPKTVRAPTHAGCGRPDWSGRSRAPAARTRKAQGRRRGGRTAQRTHQREESRKAPWCFRAGWPAGGGAPDETIWAVAKRLGTHIPHLCHKPAPGYRPDGNCRACMVEIEGERVLAASCKRTPGGGHEGEDRDRARHPRRAPW